MNPDRFDPEFDNESHKALKKAAGEGAIPQVFRAINRATTLIKSHPNEVTARFKKEYQIHER